jgi:thymidine phosphorylase
MLAQHLEVVGRALGLSVHSAISDGRQPVGRGVGPALEASDVVAVLRGDPGAPPDLHTRAVAIAAGVFALAPVLQVDPARLAASILADGRAWRKFQAICEAQGGMREPQQAPHTRPVVATRDGTVAVIDNRRLARLAKLAGAPQAPTAGLVLEAPIGTRVTAGQPLVTLHAEAPGELAYALAYADANPDVLEIR